MAAGADGLLIEVHPDPDRALSDAAQTLNLTDFDRLLESVRRMAPLLQRRVDGEQK